MITYLDVFIVAFFILMALLLMRWPQLYMDFIHIIGPTEVGVVRKTISSPLSFSSLLFSSGGGEGALKMNGEAGYQIDYLETGWWIRPWPIYIVEKHPWPQVPSDGKGIVIAQVGEPLGQG